MWLSDWQIIVCDHQSKTDMLWCLAVKLTSLTYRHTVISSKHGLFRLKQRKIWYFKVINHIIIIYCFRYTAGQFLFGHSESIAGLFTALGLYNDSQPFLASSRVALQNRQMRTSTLMPFSSNLALVLYACKAGANDVNQDTTFGVKLLVNEEPVQLPGCPDASVCPLQTVLDRYASLVNNCNSTEICHYSKPVNQATPVVLSVGLLVMMSLLYVV